MNSVRPRGGAAERTNVGSLSGSNIRAIRHQAERFLEMHGFATPPLPSHEALAARRLEVSPVSLDDLLIRAHLLPEDAGKIQAMLNANEGTVAFKRGLPTKKRQWGALHEVGHEFIPWHREVLYYCPLFTFPDHLQSQFEVEADRFAAEAFFFGRQFHRQAYAGEISLQTAVELATDVYETSLHATFTHYVRESPSPRCLLVWKRVDENGTRGSCAGFKVHYFVKSRGFHCFVDQNRIEDPEEAVAKVFTDPDHGTVNHHLVFNGQSGQFRVALAESFSNSYNVFTLLSPPEARSIHPVTA